MQSVYRLKASELDNRFIQGLKSTYEGKEIEIIVCEVDKNKDIVQTNSNSLSERRAFLKLPLNKRREILAKQTENIQEHYQQSSEWKEWLAGDIVDY